MIHSHKTCDSFSYVLCLTYAGSEKLWLLSENLQPYGQWCRGPSSFRNPARVFDFISTSPLLPPILITPSPSVAHCILYAMASPPYQSSAYRSPAASPPNPAHSVLPNPRKRPLSTTLQTGGFNKKRKPSSFSATSSTHPLRQTSFPPEEGQGGERSPSVESDYTTVTASHSVATSTKDGGRKRGRRKRDSANVKSPGKNRAATDGGSKTGILEDEPEDDEVEAADDGLVDDNGGPDSGAEEKNLSSVLKVCRSCLS